MIERALDEDHEPPFSDHALAGLAAGTRQLVSIDAPAVAILGDGEAELVVDPAHRRRGLGSRLLDHVVELSPGPLLVWSHGDHPGARSLAASRGFVAVREVLQLRAPVDPAAAHAVDERISPFRDRADAEDWVALNALAFAGHPEQGRVSLDDFDVLTANEWFDPDDLFLLRDASGELLGSCWLKIDDGLGEFYVVGVDPRLHGRGLGRSLVAAGMAHLAARGIRTASLYVDGGNAAALALYRAFGFERHAIDIQYSRRGM